MPLVEEKKEASPERIGPFERNKTSSGDESMSSFIIHGESSGLSQSSLRDHLPMSNLSSKNKKNKNPQDKSIGSVDDVSFGPPSNKPSSSVLAVS